eukprot:5106330-Amphidinium_carterae.1
MISVLKVAYPDAHMIPSLGKPLFEFLADHFGYVGADAVVLLVFSPPTLNWGQKFHLKAGEPRVAVCDIVSQFLSA